MALLTRMDTNYNTLETLITMLLVLSYLCVALVFFNMFLVGVLSLQYKVNLILVQANWWLAGIVSILAAVALVLMVPMAHVQRDVCARLNSVENGVYELLIAKDFRQV